MRLLALVILGSALVCVGFMALGMFLGLNF